MMRSRRSCSSQRKATHPVLHIHAVFFSSSFHLTRQRAIATWILLCCPDSVQLTGCLSLYLSLPLVPRVESSQQILLLLLLSNIYDRFCHNDDKVYNSNNKYNSRIEEEQQSGRGSSSHDLPSIPSPPLLLFFLPLIIEYNDIIVTNVLLFAIRIWSLKPWETGWDRTEDRQRSI